MTPSRRLTLQSFTVALLAALAAFAALNLLHADLPHLEPFDLALQSALHAQTTPALTYLMRALTFIGSIEVFIPTLLAAVILFADQASKTWILHNAALTNGTSHWGWNQNSLVTVDIGPDVTKFHYNPDFYAAYVRDPDGNKLAAVCRGFTQRPTAPMP